MSTFEDGVNAAEAGDYASALQLFISLAEGGDFEAASYAGSLLVTHLHRPDYWFHTKDPAVDYDIRRAEEKADIDEAVKWLTVASEGGNGPAAHNLAFLYATQVTEIPRDEARRLATFYLDRSHEVGGGACGAMKFHPRSWFDTEDPNLAQALEDDMIVSVVLQRKLFGDPPSTDEIDTD